MGYVAGQNSLLITNIVLVIAAELSIALRFWVRNRLKSQYQADDWCALAAGIVFLMNNVTMCWAISQKYMGIDPYTMEPAQLEVSLKLVFSGIFIMSIILTFCRFSVLFLYNRVFGVYRTFQRILIVFGVVSLMWPFTIWFATAFRCSPIKGSWNPFIASKCAFSIEDLFIGTEPINAVLDILLVLLPISKIKMLQLPFKDRVGLCFIFLLGGFVGITSILRIVFTYNPSKLGAVVDSVFWLELQLGTAIICCCLPTLRSLLPNATLFAPITTSIRRVFRSRKSSYISNKSRSRTTMGGKGFENMDKQKKKDIYNDGTTIRDSNDQIALSHVSTRT